MATAKDSKPKRRRSAVEQDREYLANVLNVAARLVPRGIGRPPTWMQVHGEPLIQIAACIVDEATRFVERRRALLKGGMSLRDAQAQLYKFQAATPPVADEPLDIPGDTSKQIRLSDCERPPFEVG